MPKPKGKWDDEMRWKQGLMLWNSDVQRQIEVIGNYIEAISRNLEANIYPSVDVRNREGKFNVNLIMETAVLKLSRDLSQVTDEQWKRYEETYLTMRDTADNHKIHVSEIMTKSFEAMEKHLSGRMNVMHAGKVNRKLFIALALAYTVDKIQG